MGHWKWECPNVVQDGVVQQSTNVGPLQNTRGPKLRNQNPNFQNNMVQMQGLQPMQQMQMPRVQPAQMQQVQQQVPMAPRQQMQLPMAPMGQQQVMLPQQVTDQVMSQNNTVQQFPLRGEVGMNEEWSDDSSDSEKCRLAASLEVDQRGPYVEGKVMGHKVSFLVDTGATHSTVRSAEVPKLPLSGRTIRVVRVANQYLTNPITDPVQIEIGNFQGLHKFVVCDSSPVSLLGRDLLCKTKCSITCSNDGIEVQTNSDDEGDDGQFSELETETANEDYPLITLFLMLTVTDLPAELQGTVTEKVWDLTGKEVGLIKGVEPVKVQVKPNAVFPQVPQYHMAQDVLIQVAQIIADFVKQGVLKEVLSSPCNSPIMGLKKPCGKVRIVQDLRKINEIVMKCCPIVPNPAVIMFQVPCDAEWFTVVDLSQAFFSIPLHEDSQFLVSFKFLDKVYSWCRIPQGFSESPSIFNQILKKDLESLVLPFNSTLVQYIDDLLIASRTKDDCKYDTFALLNHLGKNGHKVSPKKLQYCQKEVYGGANCPVAYFSATLEPVAAALPGCLRAVAAVGQSLTQCEGIVMGHPLTVMVPHSVESLLSQTKTQHMTIARLTRYETIILGSPNVSLKRCTVLNPTTLLPVENTEINNEEEVEHDCLEVTELCTKARPDIQDTQLLKENDCMMFVDGSCLRDSFGMLRDGYAVCTIAGIIEASWLERVYSAQVAELIALTKACHAAENLRVTIYTDSRYGFGIVHDFGQLWLQRGFMTSSGSPVKNGEQFKDLLHAIQLPLEIAVVKCNAHVKSQDFGGHSDLGGKRPLPPVRSPPYYRRGRGRPPRSF
ncbi:hypothetical protein NDU88_004924 [Pleurodeles waltl]|uniref:ribonuclease H n=1 Tax=Pleurodeles waltl TaxID=8319 RepID=A0AAV7NQQ6_PLEWA|nr:hypothetical protein NDU88_004924 [Pleurodeles waltl]